MPSHRIWQAPLAPVVEASIAWNAPSPTAVAGTSSSAGTRDGSRASGVPSVAVTTSRGPADRTGGVVPGRDVPV